MRRIPVFVVAISALWATICAAQSCNQAPAQKYGGPLFDAMAQVESREAGAVVRRDELARGALGRALLPFDRSIDVHVSRLRKKLGPRPGGGERIATLRAVGYMYTS